MQSELKSLSKIFSESIFRIPDYQRGYAWNLKQLKEFWSDIEQLPDNKSHYTGVLTLEPASKEQYKNWEDDIWIIESKNYSPLYIVDGQQRLTTAIILIHCIMERLKENQLINYTEKKEIQKKYISESKDKGISHSYIFGYEKDNPSYEFLKQKIYGHRSTTHSTIEDTSYTKNLQCAKNFFDEMLDTISFEEMEKFYSKLTQKLLFNIFHIEKELDVFVTFETMNNRGKPLSHLELLKNRLIYLSTKFQEEHSEKLLLRKTINESWKTIYHYLGRIQSKEFNDEVFLKTHFVFYFGAEVKENEIIERQNFAIHRLLRLDSYKDYLLDKVFTPKRINSFHHNAENMDSIEEIDEITLDEVYKYAQSMKELVYLFHKVTTPKTSDLPSGVIEKITQIQRLEDYEMFILTIAILKIGDRSKRLDMLKTVEKIGFLTSIRSYHFHDYDVYNTVIDIVSGKKTLEESLLIASKKSAQFIESKELTDALRVVGKTNGYYGWQGLRYFLFEYEQFLLKNTKSQRQILKWDMENIEDYSSDYKTVEHIYPQKANDPYWSNQMKAYSVQQRNKLRNSLGNLLPVSHPKNASLSNKSFPEKKGSSSNQVGYSYGCLSEIQVAQEANWGAREILVRGLKLLSFMEERWDFKLGDIDEKIDILGLRFVLDMEEISAADISKMVLGK